MATNQSAFMPYDPASKDGGYIPGQSKNLGVGNGLYDYQSSMQGQQPMLTNQLMQDVGMSQSELLGNFSKMKPYDMQYSGMSGLMGSNMNMYNSKMHHQKDSFDNQDQAYSNPQRAESFTITNPLLPNSRMKPRIPPTMGLMSSFNNYPR
jgi:hypothetical protein